MFAVQNLFSINSKTHENEAIELLEHPVDTEHLSKCFRNIQNAHVNRRF